MTKIPPYFLTCKIKIYSANLMPILENTSIEDGTNALETPAEIEAPVPEEMVRWLSQITIDRTASK